MDLASLLSKDIVKVPLEAVDKEEAIAELLELLVRAGRVADRDALLNSLYEREDKGSTGIGAGVAIPHAKNAALQGVAVAVGVSPDGVEFDAADGQPVHLVFLVVAGVNSPGLNVEVLADIGGLMQVPGLYEQLTAARSADELINAIANVQVEQ
jgi:mannitol/fructose-specific phosphotransferase system IIA component (Ntr-type)